jgi:hypothetical protein
VERGARGADQREAGRCGFAAPRLDMLAPRANPLRPPGEPASLPPPRACTPARQGDGAAVLAHTAAPHARYFTEVHKCNGYPQAPAEPARPNTSCKTTDPAQTLHAQPLHDYTQIASQMGYVQQRSQ